MALKMEPVPGAPKDSYRATKPVMTCDGCNTSKLDGNPGSDNHQDMKSKAYDLGWRKDTRTSKDYCPTCVPPTSPPGTTGSKMADALKQSMAASEQGRAKSK